MEKSFTKIAEDVVAGIGLIRDSSPSTMKAFSSLAPASPRHPPGLCFGRPSGVEG